MRAYDGCGPAVQIPGERKFLGCGFGMNIDENYFCLDFFQQFVGDTEGVIVGRHEHAALQIDHSVGDVIFAPFVHAPSRQVWRIVRWTQQASRHAVLVPVCHLEIVDDFSLVPDVIARDDYVNAEFKQVFRHRPSNAKPTGGVLPVSNHQVDGVIFHQARQTIFDDVASRPPKNVADKENSHEVESIFRW